MCSFASTFSAVWKFSPESSKSLLRPGCCFVHCSLGGFHRFAVRHPHSSILSPFAVFACRIFIYCHGKMNELTSLHQSRSPWPFTPPLSRIPPRPPRALPRNLFSLIDGCSCPGILILFFLLIRSPHFFRPSCYSRCHTFCFLVLL